MTAGNLILILLGALAVYGLLALFRQKGAAPALGGMALAGFIGYLVQSADGERLQRVLAPDGAAPALAVEANPLVAQPASNPDPSYSPREQRRRTHAADRSTHNAEPRMSEFPKPSSESPVVTKREAEPIPSVPPAVGSRREAGSSDQVEFGGVQIVVEGSWGVANSAALESAIREALRRAEWDGLHSGGRKVLRVRGTVEDRGLTLGQIPTASATLNWSLESPSGAVMAEGGLMDVQGTGVDDAAARAAALRRAAGRVASELSH